MVAQVTRYTALTTISPVSDGYGRRTVTAAASVFAGDGRHTNAREDLPCHTRLRIPLSPSLR